MAATQDIVTPSGVTLRVSAKTGLRGLDARTINAIQAMVQAAPAAGLSVIDITAGREGGHLSHLKGGTEVDLKGYNADGSLWSPAQRVAIAAGAQEAGANRFGLYSFGKGKTGSGSMHVGFSGVGKPAAVWGANGKVRGDASRRFTDPSEKAFFASYQTGQPFDTASLGMPSLASRETAPQTAQSAIADLVNPAGGTLAPIPPPAMEAYAPYLPAEGPTPEAPPVPPTFTPDFDFAASPGPTFTPPPMSRSPGPGGALGVDLGQQPAGMPLPPSRPDTFDWLGGGAPPAAMVPPPGISPLRPALGGPGDRRPQPPIPTMRPAGGPPPYPAASMANMPGMVGMPPSAPPGSGGAFSAPGTPSDLVPFLPPPAATAAPAIAPPLERANRIAGGQGGPVIPLTPDEMRSSLANANANTEMSLGLGGGRLGTPETAMSLDRTFPPPRPSWDQLQSESDSRLLASDIARTRGMMERSMAPLPRFDTAPPPARPTITPDFDFAASPGPTFTPPSLTPDIRGRPEYPGSMPLAPPPVTTRPMPSYPLRSGDTMLDKTGKPIFSVGEITNNGKTALFRIDSNGIPQQSLTDEDLAFGLSKGWQIEHQAPLPQGREGDVYAKAYGGPRTSPSPVPDLAAQLGIHNIATAAPEIPYDPLSSARLNLPPAVPAVPAVPAIPPAPGRVILGPDVDPYNIPDPTITAPAAAVDAEQAPTIDPVVAAANMPVRPRQPIVAAAAAAAAAPAKTTEEQKKRGGVPSFLAPFFGGGGVAGFFGGFGTPPAFTPYANPIMNTGFGGTIRTSGKTPSGTPWSTGTSNALGGSNALRWTGSGGQTITAYTDPTTGQTFHSFS